MKNPYLSKSLFIKGLQCHKALWLTKNSPDLAAQPDKSLELRFAEGTEVGILAQDLFPGGEEVPYGDPKKMSSQTKELIDGGLKTIYEATFSFDNILVRVDILHRGDDGWEIYEVKQGTEVKDVNFSDVAIQYHVLNGSGLNINKAALVHINNQYVRKGDINVHELFTIADLTEEVKTSQDLIKNELSNIRNALRKESTGIDIGPHCGDPYDCNYIDHCWSHVPENSIFDLHEKGIDKFDYYNRGIIHFSDLDLEELNNKQRMQVETELSGEKTLDKKSVEGFLKTLRYPLYFLDFETFMRPIPPFDDTRPYGQIPFQYSVHYLESEGAGLKHDEFLAKTGTDPREELARRLTTLIPDNACVVVYNASFEKRILEGLAKQFPKQKVQLLKIVENIVDLMIPFRSRHYYTKEMKGSYSIKYVLPALIPELGYDNMAIGGGQEASAAYSTIHMLTEDEAAQTRKALLEYCKLDTLAMVELLGKLKDTTYDGKK